MPTLYPAAATPGTALRFKSTGVVVKLISSAGELCQVRLPDNTWTYAPMKDLEYGFSTETVNDAKGAPIDPHAVSSVRPGPVTPTKAMKALCDALNGKISKEEGARRMAAEANNPGLSFLAGPYSEVADRAPLSAGATLLHKATNSACTLVAASAEKNLFVIRLANGCLEVAKSEELLTTTREPLTKLTDGGTLQKMGKSGSFNRGDRVRLRVGVHPWAAGKEGVLKLCGRTAWVEFDDGAGVFELEQIEAI